MGDKNCWDCSGIKFTQYILFSISSIDQVVPATASNVKRQKSCVFDSSCDVQTKSVNKDTVAFFTYYGLNYFVMVSWFIFCVLNFCTFWIYFHVSINTYITLGILRYILKLHIGSLSYLILIFLVVFKIYFCFYYKSALLQKLLYIRFFVAYYFNIKIPLKYIHVYNIIA